jgi:hypothetical protein
MSCLIDEFVHDCRAAVRGAIHPAEALARRLIIRE